MARVPVGGVNPLFAFLSRLAPQGVPHTAPVMPGGVMAPPGYHFPGAFPTPIQGGPVDIAPAASPAVGGHGGIHYFGPGGSGVGYPQAPQPVPPTQSGPGGIHYFGPGGSGVAYPVGNPLAGGPQRAGDFPHPNQESGSSLFVHQGNQIAAGVPHVGNAIQALLQALGHLTGHHNPPAQSNPRLRHLQ